MNYVDDHFFNSIDICRDKDAGLGYKGNMGHRENHRIRRPAARHSRRPRGLRPVHAGTESGDRDGGGVDGWSANGLIIDCSYGVKTVYI